MRPQQVPAWAPPACRSGLPAGPGGRQGRAGGRAARTAWGSRSPSRPLEPHLLEGAPPCACPGPGGRSPGGGPRGPSLAPPAPLPSLPGSPHPIPVQRGVHGDSSEGLGSSCSNGSGQEVPGEEGAREESASGGQAPAEEAAALLTALVTAGRGLGGHSPTKRLAEAGVVGPQTGCQCPGGSTPARGSPPGPHTGAHRLCYSLDKAPPHTAPCTPKPRSSPGLVQPLRSSCPKPIRPARPGPGGKDSAASLPADGPRAPAPAQPV